MFEFTAFGSGALKDFWQNHKGFLRSKANLIKNPAKTLEDNIQSRETFDLESYTHNAASVLKSNGAFVLQTVCVSGNLFGLCSSARNGFVAVSGFRVLVLATVA